MYGMSGDTRSCHCLWLMLVVSLSQRICGVTVAGHRRTYVSFLAAMGALRAVHKDRTGHRVAHRARLFGRRGRSVVCARRSALAARRHSANCAAA
jgi:hypothetical protein